MLLIYSILSPKGNIRQSIFYSDNLNVCLDVLNIHIRSGHLLLSATLEEMNGSHTRLPVEALDGSPISDDLQCLQDEWEQILNLCL